MNNNNFKWLILLLVFVMFNLLFVSAFVFHPKEKEEEMVISKLKEQAKTMKTKIKTVKK